MGDFDLDGDDGTKVVPPPAKVTEARAPEPQRQRVRVSADVEPEYVDPEELEREHPAVDPTEDLGRVPPHDLDAEAAVLSAVMLDPAALPAIVDFLKAEHFYSEAHRRIFEAAVWLYENGGVVDVILIGARLKTTERLGQIGGMPYLSEIMNGAPAVTNVRKYGVVVFDHWRARRIIENARHVLMSGYLGVSDVQAYADRATIAMGDIARRSVGALGMTNVEALKEILGRLEKPKDGAPTKRGIPTGYRTIDRMTGGLHAC